MQTVRLFKNPSILFMLTQFIVCCHFTAVCLHSVFQQLKMKSVLCLQLYPMYLRLARGVYLLAENKEYTLTDGQNKIIII